MQNRKKLIIIGLIIICFALNTPITVKAEDSEEAIPETLAVTLVIDTSGSMANTDEQKLRETAANIFIDLLSPDDYLGIVTFNTQPSIVQDLEKVSSSENKERIKENLTPYFEAKGKTDYTAAFGEAYDQLMELNDGNVRKVVIFLTDGEPSIKKKAGDPTNYMDIYMESMWDMVDLFAINKIPIYTIGFSNEVKQDTVKRIASDTAGDFSVLDDQGELAERFFEFLGDLKSRKSIMDVSMELLDGSGIDVAMDEYTSQATIAIVNDINTSYEVELLNPSGEKVEDTVNINKTDKYTIVTLNTKGSSSYGNWRINIIGTGKVDIFYNKDLIVKAWIKSPASLSMQSLKEPLEIKVDVTGAVQDGISVVAIVKNITSSDSDEIQLKYENGIYKGVYNKTNVPGTYSIKINVLLDNTIISSSEEQIEIRVIPVLTCDFYLKEEGYRLGEKVGITSALKLKGIQLTPSDVLHINNYSLLISNEDGTSRTISLKDDGNKENNDILAADGVWSGWIDFSKKTTVKMSLIVTGTYKDDYFVLEKELGTGKVSIPGKINIISSKDSLRTKIGNVVSIPVIVENNSNFSEVLSVELDSKAGSLLNSKYTLEPNSKNNLGIDILVDKNVVKGIYDMELKFKAGCEMTQVDSVGMPEQIEVVSRFASMIDNIKGFFSGLNSSIVFPVIVLVLAIVVLGVVAFIVGILLQHAIYKRKMVIRGTLGYYSKEKKPLGEMDKKIELERFNKQKIIISFNEQNKEADFIIKNAGLTYDITISAEPVKANATFLAGWKALFRKSASVRFKVSATPPGIIEMNGIIFSNKTIEDGCVFETGGYVFRYLELKHKIKSETKTGRNILEGKNEKGRSL